MAWNGSIGRTWSYRLVQKICPIREQTVHEDRDGHHLSTLVGERQEPFSQVHTGSLPSIGREDFYDAADGTILFTEEDHRRIVTLLHATNALMALSSYEHPLLNELYPVSRWRHLP
jgi:hypothetical protein